MLGGVCVCTLCILQQFMAQFNGIHIMCKFSIQYCLLMRIEIQRLVQINKYMHDYMKYNSMVFDYRTIENLWDCSMSLISIKCTNVFLFNYYIIGGRNREMILASAVNEQFRLK